MQRETNAGAACDKHDKANELMTNWSKWLTTINVFAATGCVVGLKTAGGSTEKVGLYFFCAIVSFCLSVICSTLFVFLLARQDCDRSENKSLQFTWLAKLQWLMFTAGLLFVLIWIGFLSKTW